MNEDKAPKKPIYKKWWFWLIILILAIAVFGGSSGNNEKPAPGTTQINPSATSIPSATPKQTASPTPKVKTYGSGQYKVGSDIAAGEYVLLTSSSGYLEIDKDSSGKFDSIIANDNFTNRSYVTVSDGQYLKITNCTMYAAADAPKVTPTNNTLPAGMYKVGVDVPAGEYKVVPSGSGYLEVTSSSSHTFDSIISNDNFKGEQYITINNGEYIKLQNASLKLG